MWVQCHFKQPLLSFLLKQRYSSTNYESAFFKDVNFCVFFNLTSVAYLLKNKQPETSKSLGVFWVKTLLSYCLEWNTAQVCGSCTHPWFFPIHFLKRLFQFLASHSMTKIPRLENPQWDFNTRGCFSQEEMTLSCQACWHPTVQQIPVHKIPEKERSVHRTIS